ncbi:DUF2126 domain-containing protein [Zavarzinia sp. CC-PAN008]|uniref:transglutaminase family protein n=1 Tax=Zavarzinia sp. CC-PAN008 TaxID=3243332 RepID=UPI003F7457C3
MTIRVALNHKTTYRYDRLVSLGPQVIRLRPAPHCRTPIASYSLKITPRQHFLNWQQDPQSNWLARAVFPEKTDLFEVEVDLIADMAVINPFDFFLEKEAESFPFAYAPELERELAPYLETLPRTPQMAALIAAVDLTPRATVNFLVDLNRIVQERVDYVIRMEPGVQTPEQTLDIGRGSCRDSAWLLLQLARHLGLAARFVSGYLIQLTPDMKPIDGPPGPENDFTDLHAWTEVYLPGAGWVGLDPTSGLFAGEGHIPLAATPEPSSAAPISGAVDEAEVEFGFSMTVTRVEETVRVPRPYREEDWQQVLKRGQEVEAELKARDVRLTMGGEPTFVATFDFDEPEWNTAAVGGAKRRLAGDLLWRLKRRFAPGGLLFYGQGKWYPGEQLPRWALGCHWRTDGHPIWRDESLLADESRTYGFLPEDAEAFAEALATRLSITPKAVLAAFEDPWYHIWREQRLPVNVDPLDSKLEDPQERARLAQNFERGLDVPTGFVLPVQRIMTQAGPLWQAGPWPRRRRRLYLHPGNSPVGYRLPLDSLPHAAPSDYPYHFETDPLDQRSPLPPQIQPPPPRPPTAEEEERALAGQAVGPSAGWVIRTALCVEEREGRLYVFMPPQETLEAYLELVAAIEDTARTLGRPVILEGYSPPGDYRLAKILVTPDPGVIEVNVQPSSSWTELVENTTALYEEARAARLTTEKFLTDGRHVGTGGGNHVVVGGATPADSPFLRRPHLLRSLLAFWQNHPSLSYLFSGLFIGPTSQAPRVDEARHDTLYELEIAFAQVPDHGDVPPWLVDRLFRHLLTDVTGNTHRSEFCIDKLFSPDSATGRLGLLELRAFEMPPHERMALVQALLVRSCIARFWDAPYPPRLVRWGTELHDRFLLPHHVAADLDDALRDMADAGWPLERAWFEPHLEFRFPRIGTVVRDGVSLELRNALEPWHVLGEEGMAGGGTARFVDSSLERIQVRLSGATPGRHALAVNGRRVPLHPTGTTGEFVAGVRFRAWQLASALHPTIPVHAPLVFDIVDEWSGRAIGGATYHVAHPGGRNFTTLPVNANEAEGRRLARFWDQGHSSGQLRLAPETRRGDFPFTLDLRRPA